MNTSPSEDEKVNWKAYDWPMSDEEFETEANRIEDAEAIRVLGEDYFA